MKPFDLQAALRGDPVVTKEGTKVTSIKFFEDAFKSPHNVRGVMNGHIASFNEKGEHASRAQDLHLFMAPKKEYVNLYWTANGRSLAVEGPYSEPGMHPRIGRHYYAMDVEVEQ
ncbi:hypothetical protein vBAfQDWS535_54 [Alcaligenes phage vB_Af_QDWS535]|nr:hypothetical protein vBAfQDWS535_54 [Alcaligenes phage vB_Af_QDWS535]